MDFHTLKRKIKNLEIQGAKEIALASLRFFRGYCKKYGFDRKFFLMAKELERVRPTAVVLHNCLEILRKEKSVEAIEKLIEKLLASEEKIAENGEKLFRKKSVVMTYCHSSEALAVIKRAWDKGKIEKVFTPETRPKMQGLKTAKELAKYGIDTVLITDNARGVFIRECDAVIVGSDAMRREGNVNKIGTFTLALLAKHFNKPFYVVGDTLKVDRRKNFVIEERSPEEITRVKTKNLQIRNPAFDITPWKFVSRILTDEKVFYSAELISLFQV